MFSYGHIKRRNMAMQVILYVITLSLYGFYWYHVTLGEMRRANGSPDENRWLWTLLLFIPIANLFSIWHYAGEYTRFIRDRYPGIAIFILWLVFVPAVWFLAQRDLNRAAGVQFMG